MDSDHENGFRVPLELEVGGEVPLGLLSTYVVSAIDGGCPVPVPMRVWGRSHRPVRAGDVRAEVSLLPGGGRVCIDDADGTTVDSFVTPGAVADEQLEPMPILAADDVISKPLAEPYDAWWRSRFEVRPLPVADAGSIGLDAWVRQHGFGAEASWASLLAIDAWGLPLLAPMPMGEIVPARLRDDAVAAPLQTFEIIVRPSARSFDAQGWLLRRSRCTVRSSHDHLFEVGALVTPAAERIATYRAIRSLVRPDTSAPAAADTDGTTDQLGG
ncbi:MAG: hypothetical protein AAF548_03575 [Actinomycetota bacterium]